MPIFSLHNYYPFMPKATEAVSPEFQVVEFFQYFSPHLQPMNYVKQPLNRLQRPGVRCFLPCFDQHYEYNGRSLLRGNRLILY